MNDKKKKQSGAQFRKRAHEKLQREEENLKKIPKIESFFQSDVRTTSKPDENSTITSTTSSDVRHDKENIESESTSEVSQDSHDENKNEILTDHTSSVKVIPSTSRTGIVIHADPAKWNVNDDLRDRIAENGVVQQNKDSDVSNSARKYSDKTRYFSKSVFSKKLVNGETVQRQWPVYSPSTGALYCAPCKLFGGISQFAVGFSDWKNCSNRVAEHERSTEHVTSVQTLITRGRLLHRIDSKLITQLQDETNYWRKVLVRVVEVVKFLASRGLAFRGEDEIFGSPNNGNFLGTMELLAKFDPFLADHIARFGNAGRGTPSYMSSTIVDELIQQMSSQVKSRIIGELKRAKYYSIIVDSTPDVTHIDQLTFIFRYVLDDGTPVERFLCFIPNPGHKGEELSKCVLEVLEACEINISDCRGQSYDNASNMSGQYSGLQARMKEFNSLATYIPCAAHSLNLIGSSAVETCKQAAEYFSLVQSLYNFFSASTHRWSVLTSHTKKGSFTLKSLSITRWSARADANKVLFTSYNEIIAALKSISQDEAEKANTRSEAGGLTKKLNRLEITIMICFWHRVLSRFHFVSAELQSPEIDLCTVIKLYDSLEEYVTSLRDDFDLLETEGIKMYGSGCYESSNKRKSIRKRQFDESNEGDTVLEGREHYKIFLFYPIVDKLKSELVRRREVYKDANKKFGFFTKLKSMEDKEIRQCALHLLTEYSADLDDELPEECLQVKAIMCTIDEDVSTHLKLLKSIKSMNCNTVFANVEVALRIYLSSASTNCTGERSFSTLKRVKNYLRSSMTENKLNDLSLLCIESKILRELNFEDVIKRFSEEKARKKPF